MQKPYDLELLEDVLKENGHAIISEDLIVEMMPEVYNFIQNVDLDARHIRKDVFLYLLARYLKANIVQSGIPLNYEVSLNKLSSGPLDPEVVYGAIYWHQINSDGLGVSIMGLADLFPDMDDPKPLVKVIKELMAKGEVVKYEYGEADSYFSAVELSRQREKMSFDDACKLYQQIHEKI